MSHSEARERVLAAAEALFVERGYEAVTVKHIAKRAGINHASIYHHLPEGGGKEALYIEVMTRNFTRHQTGIQAALDDAAGDLEQQLRNVAGWLLAHPPLDFVRMSNSDFAGIKDQIAAEALRTTAFNATIEPLYRALAAAQARGEIDHPNLGNIAGGLLSAIEGVQSIPAHYVEGSRQQMADELIAVFLRGITVRR